MASLLSQEQTATYKPLVIVGPSAAGKGTLINEITQKYPGKFGFSISFTTRQPRGKEQNGVEYFFISKEEFEKLISEDGFIEYAHVHSNYYGTAKSQLRDIQASKRIPLLDIDIQGAKKVAEANIDATYIFICPPSLALLEERMRKRGQDKEEQIQTRLKNALWEIPDCLTFDKLEARVVNDDLEKSKREFVALVEAYYEKELLC